MINELIKSIIDQDITAIVVCDLEHTIIYMNPAAIARYAKRGGDRLIGKSLKNCHNPESNELIDKVIDWFKRDTSNNRIFMYHNDKENKDAYMVALRREDGDLIGYYEKHEFRDPETAKPYDFK